MKQKEINTLSSAELQEKFTELKRSYAELTAAHAITPIENPLRIRSVRRAIARLATELTKRQVQ